MQNQVKPLNRIEPCHHGLEGFGHQLAHHPAQPPRPGQGLGQLPGSELKRLDKGANAADAVFLLG